MNLDFAATAYRTIRDRIRAEDATIDERTLADTVEGLTDLHEIIAAIVRSALADEALATGLKGRVAEMQDRLERLQDCAAKRRQIAKDGIVELDLKKIRTPDFTVSIRPGMPALLVLDEAAVPSIYWTATAHPHRSWPRLPHRHPRCLGPHRGGHRTADAASGERRSHCQHF